MLVIQRQCARFSAAAFTAFRHWPRRRGVSPPVPFASEHCLAVVLSILCASPFFVGCVSRSCTRIQFRLVLFPPAPMVCVNSRTVLAVPLARVYAAFRCRNSHHRTFVYGSSNRSMAVGTSNARQNCPTMPALVRGSSAFSLCCVLSPSLRCGHCVLSCQFS